MMRTLLLIIALTAVAGVASAAPVTIDFDDTLPTYFGLSSYQEDGFTLTSNVPDGTLIDVNDVVRANLGIFSGGTSSQSLFWGENGSTSTLALSADSGAQFDLLGLDASSLGNLTGQLTLTGTLAGGGTTQQVLALDGDLTTYNISGFTGLSGLEISFDGASFFAPFDLDNIQLSVIPVPAAIWLFMSGLAGLAGWSRRRTVD